MDHSGNIYVINRHDERVPMDIATISNRLKQLAQIEPKLSISTDYIAIQTTSRLVNNIKTSEIDDISANICSSLIIENTEYDTLAARILISNLHKNTHDTFLEYMHSLKTYQYHDKTIYVLHPDTIAFIEKYHAFLDRMVDYTKDYTYNYFGVMTLMKSYLLSHKYENNKIILERPQQMLARVAIGLHMNKIDTNGNVPEYILDDIQETYMILSDKYYTHATPTLFNAGTVNHTLSSCYLLSIDDNLDNIYKRLHDISKISKFSGGIGVHVSMVRANNSVIGSTIGKSQGLVPMLRVFNESTKYVSQGGGKRAGSTAVYLEPWHADIESCLRSQKHQGIPDQLCKDLFLALWIPDLFMKRLKRAIETREDVKWSLMCPDECPRLTDVYGEEFEELYHQYETEKRYRKQVSIIDLWQLMMSIQIETGRPYLMYKDHVNRKCNQNHLGVIKSSNLCVSGETQILTKEGYYSIQHLEGRDVDVWNGNEFSTVHITKTGEDQDLVVVKTKDGCELECTPYHKFHIINNNMEEIIIEAKDLKEGYKLKRSEFPIISGLDVCMDEDEYRSGYYTMNNWSKISVPVNASIKSKLEWLAGFIDANGYFSVNGSTHTLKSNHKKEIQSFQIMYIHKNVLMSVKLLCNTLGTNPVILDYSKKDNIIFQNKQVKYMLSFNPFDTYKLIHLGMRLRILQYNEVSPQYFTRPENTIVSVTPLEKKKDTFCFNEPINHTGIFNGILTGNCSEINIYSDTKNVGVCNLASICLPKFVTIHENRTASFDYKKLHEITQKVTINLNKVIDNNKYPIEEAQYSDHQNRPIGIGVQGLSEVFMMFRESYTSEISKQINRSIFETIYHGALTSSMKLAKKYSPYPNFPYSMTAKGILQFDLWRVTPSSGLWDWTSLRNDIKQHGLYNSLLVALMPTASTSILMNHTECIEPPQSNMYTRSTMSGRFQVVNTYLINDLKKLNLWNKRMQDLIMINNGSIASIKEIPKKIRDIYKTAYEYKLKDMLDMDIDRSAYVCQSSSSNRYIQDPTINKLTNMHMYAWKHGIKTSSYYIRTGSASDSDKVTVDMSLLKESYEKKKKEEEEMQEECLMCSA